LCRYVLDGDREELRNIRHELANLRTVSIGQIAGQRLTPGQGQGTGQTQTQTSMPHPATAEGQAAQFQQGVYHDIQQYQMDFQQKSPYAQPYVRESVPPASYRDQASLNPNMPTGISRGVTMISPTVPENEQDGRRDSPSPPLSAASYSYKASAAAIEKRSRSIEESEIFSEEEEEEEEERPRSGVRQAEAPLRPVTADPTRSFHQPDYAQRAQSSSSSSVPTKGAYTDAQQSQRRVAQQASETERNLRQQIQDLLDTGVYDDEDDPVIRALRAELLEAERSLVSL
jgi:hypothetical protein